jgi:hypothetical protein
MRRERKRRPLKDNPRRLRNSTRESLTFAHYPVNGPSSQY